MLRKYKEIMRDTQESLVAAAHHSPQNPLRATRGSKFLFGEIFQTQAYLSEPPEGARLVTGLSNCQVALQL